MNKKLLHSLAILALALLAAKCELLTAQSGDIKRSGTELPGLHQALAPANSHADSRQPPESHPDPGAEGMAKIKGYEFRSIDYPGAYDSQVYDFNGKTAVGCVDSESSAFTFHGSSYVLLNVLGAAYSCGYGINTSGNIVGTYIDSSNYNHGFLYDGSRYTTVDYPGATDTEAWDISDSGLIVGQYYDSITTHGFLYDNGTFTTINFPGASSTSAYGINSSGDIVGVYISPGIHGFLLKNGSYSNVDFPGASQTYAFGINNAGSIAGFYVGGGSQPDNGFIYSSGAFHQVDVDGALATFVWRVNNKGTVIGYVFDLFNVPHGIVGH